MSKVQNILLVFMCFASSLNNKLLAQYNTASDVGISKGYYSDCPGSEKPLHIPKSLLNKLFVVVYQRQAGLLYWRSYSYYQAVNGIANDPKIDWRRRTVLFVSGFLDSTAFPFATWIGEAYSRLGYNVLLLDTNRFTTYPYPVAARISRAVGERVAKILAKLTYYGLNPKKLEIVGLSLGGQTSSFIGKKFQVHASTKISRLTALDPAGPCFRNLPPNLRLNSGDADFVDVIHTNIDGFGAAGAWGHVDFYVNGGEYQVASIPELPCATICSHLRALLLWLDALKTPNTLIAIKCDSIQDARYSNCYQRIPLEINVVGLSTLKNVTGIFYLSTSNRSPYGLGKSGLRKGSNSFDRQIQKHKRGPDIDW